jgi:hypothetical protein
VMVTASSVIVVNHRVCLYSRSIAAHFGLPCVLCVIRLSSDAFITKCALCTSFWSVKGGKGKWISLQVMLLSALLVRSSRVQQCTLASRAEI